MIPDHLERAVHGLYATHALHLADRHGVFRRLAEHGPAEPAELAAALDRDAETLTRLLTLLDALEIVTKDGEKYAIPEAVKPYVDERDPRYRLGFVDHVVNGTAERMPLLSDYLRQGKETTDATRPAPFAEIYDNDESVGEFLAAMWSLSHDVSRELVPLADLGGVSTLLDVGGASGPFSVAALTEHPGLTATVFDLPQVEKHLDATRERFGLGARLRFVPGDFFRDELPPAECVAFGYILSDWTDETSLDLLRKAHKACAPGGRVMIMERLFDDDRRGPLSTAVMNLSMHLETQGRHRTPAEYIALLEGAGFTDCAVRRSTRDKHLVIGHRA